MPNKLFLACLVFSSVGLNATGQTLLKLGADQEQLKMKLLLLFSGIAMYGISTVLYVLLLRTVNLSVAYPLLIGLTLCATIVSGALVLGEKITMLQWFGLGLMLSGLAAIGIGKVL